MAVKYLLPCQCGHPIEIDTTQAGQDLICRCGQTIEVPTLRGIRRLDVSATGVSGPLEPNWTVQQGFVFVFGVLTATIAVAFAVHFLLQLRKLDTAKPQFEEFNLRDPTHVTPVQAWDYWQQTVAQGLGRRRTPRYLADRRRARQLYMWIGVVGAVALAGAAVTSSAFFLRPNPTPGAGRRPPDPAA